MIRRPPAGRRKAAWIHLIAFTLLVYATVPLARTIQGAVADRWGREAFKHGVIAVVVLLGLALLLALRRVAAQATWGQRAWLVVVAAVTVARVRLLETSPEEAVHFLEYGVLGVLAFRALGHRLHDAGVYTCAALLCALLGLGDEVLQWVTPRRYFDFRDVGFNALGSVLALVGLALGLRPAWVAPRLSAASVSLACRLATALVLALGACASNTPARVRAYAEAVPGLGFLARTAGPMSEFGHRHVVPDLGVFTSRMTLDELRAEDERRGVEAGRVLDEWRDPARYAEFVVRWSPGVDAFVHEARVHVFRRDRFRDRVREPGEDQERKVREHATIAMKEDEILERWFGRAIAAARMGMPEDERARLRPLVLRDETYESAVSAGVHWRMTEGQLWLGLVALVGLLLVIERRAAAR